MNTTFSYTDIDNNGHGVGPRLCCILCGEEVKTIFSTYTVDTISLTCDECMTDLIVLEI